MKLIINKSFNTSNEAILHLLHADGTVTQNPEETCILREAEHWMKFSKETSSRIPVVWHDDDTDEHVVETPHFNNYDSTEEGRFKTEHEASDLCNSLLLKRRNEMIQSLPLVYLPKGMEIELGAVNRGGFPQDRNCSVYIYVDSGFTLVEDVHWTTNEASDNNYNFNRVEKTIKDMLEAIHGFEYSSEVEIDK